MEQTLTRRELLESALIRLAHPWLSWAQSQVHPTLRDRIGAAHVDGKYHLSSEPFLVEGAQKLIELGTKVGKFWFESGRRAAQSYPFNSQWGNYPNLIRLAQSSYFEQVFELPFSTIILVTDSSDNEWINRDYPQSFYDDLSEDSFELAAYLYKKYRYHLKTFILQPWELDWVLRGEANVSWNPPPDDWPLRCERMIRWLAAHQRGVAEARAKHGSQSLARVSYAAEVNRVIDGWRGIPTVTHQVLPHVELDLISYSCWESLKSPLLLSKCLAEIRRHARSTQIFDRNMLYIGEVGIPENVEPNQISQRWQKLLKVLIKEENIPLIMLWQLYCNETQNIDNPPPVVRNPNHLKGFWLVRPDGSLSETGKFFQRLWIRS